MPKKTTSVPVKDQEAHAWHALSAEEAARRLATPADRGLDEAEAARRLESYGRNEIASAAGPTFLQLLLAQFNNFIILLLIGAAAISGLLGEWIDAAAILAIVVLNAALGVIQERRAEEALAALKKLAAPEAQVLRGGSRLTVAAPELVPGDIVFIEAGNFVPADLRLVEAVNLRLEEAALTGESVPVQKDADVCLGGDVPLGDRKNTTFMGTMVNSGRGRGLVVSTGMHTQIGLIAAMLQNVEKETTPLQKRLDGLGKVLGIAAMAVCALVFALGILRGHAPLEMFMLAVGLAIAAVPEGLPAVVTISLALGMHEMVKRHALIRRLSSVETLGSTTVICSDKTGTLTQNKMTVTRLWADGQSLTITGSGNSLDGNAPGRRPAGPGRRLSRRPDRAVDRRPEQRRPPGDLGRKPGRRADLPPGGRPDRGGPAGRRRQGGRPAPAAQPILSPGGGDPFRRHAQEHDHRASYFRSPGRGQLPVRREPQGQRLRGGRQGRARHGPEFVHALPAPGRQPRPVGRSAAPAHHRGQRGHDP